MFLACFFVHVLLIIQMWLHLKALALVQFPSGLRMQVEAQEAGGQSLGQVQ